MVSPPNRDAEWSMHCGNIDYWEDNRKSRLQSDCHSYFHNAWMTLGFLIIGIPWEIAKQETESRLGKS